MVSNKRAFVDIFSAYFHVSKLDVEVHSDMWNGEYNF